MATTPNDVLPDGDDGTHFGAQYVRKGTIAAFIANAKILATTLRGTPEHEAAAAGLHTLEPALDAVGLFDVVTVRDPAVAAALAGRSPTDWTSVPPGSSSRRTRSAPG